MLIIQYIINSNKIRLAMSIALSGVTDLTGALEDKEQMVVMKELPLRQTW